MKAVALAGTDGPSLGEQLANHCGLVGKRHPATALGFATWSYALRRMSAGRLASLAYMIPVVAILLGWAVLGETPPWLAAVGGALCLAGVYLARRR